MIVTNMDFLKYDLINSHEKVPYIVFRIVQIV